MTPLQKSARAAGALVTALLAGCAVGPDFQKPAPPEVTTYAAAQPAATQSAPGAGGEAQHFVSNGTIAADWWTLFQSPQINALITAALANNHDLKAAQAALRAARENTAAGRGAFYPTVSAGFSATREQDPPGALAPVPSNNAFLYDLFTPQLSVSYMPDVFGQTRRNVESLAAQQQGVRYQLAATYNTLISNVLVAALSQAAVTAQIDATRRLIALYTQALSIVQYQQGKGAASGVDVAAQKTQLAAAVATLPPLIKQQVQLHDQLAALTGQYPSQMAPEDLNLAALKLPQDIPLTLPADLVAQRPDVLQAEANMHSASALIGVAIANRLPNLTLSANAGSTALQIGQVFGPGTGFWNIGAALATPIFNGGALEHQEEAAKANYQQAAEQYRSTVLNAVQNVADALAALDQDANGLKAAADAQAAAQTSLELLQRQEKDGYANHLALLAAQQAYAQAQIDLVTAQAARFSDTVALYQALGGGWWQRTELTAMNNGASNDK